MKIKTLIAISAVTLLASSFSYAEIKSFDRSNAPAALQLAQSTTVDKNATADNSADAGAAASSTVTK